MKNEAFENAFSEVKLSDVARERILRAAETGGRRREYRPGVRGIRCAAVVAAVCVLAGTALAVPPALRELLWGDFGQVAQDFDETEESVQIYDGVEARLVSAYTDGHILKAHIEFRDTEGDRLAAIFEGEDPDRSFFPIPLYMDAEGPEGAVGPLSEMGLKSVSAPRLIDFDRETGVATAEIALRQSNPAEGIERLCVSIPTGAAGTEADRREEIAAPQGDGGQVQKAPVLLMGWRLSAPIQALPVRRAEEGTVTAYLSDIGLTLLGESGDGGTVHGGAVAVGFSDGTELSGGALVGQEQILGLDGGRLMRIVDFAAPIDSENVVRVEVGEVEMLLEHGSFEQVSPGGI